MSWGRRTVAGVPGAGRLKPQLGGMPSPSARAGESAQAAFALHTLANCQRLGCVPAQTVKIWYNECIFSTEPSEGLARHSTNLAPIGGGFAVCGQARGAGR